jgi:hypothetical protein
MVIKAINVEKEMSSALNAGKGLRQKKVLKITIKIDTTISQP